MWLSICARVKNGFLASFVPHPFAGNDTFVVLSSAGDSLLARAG